MKPPIVFAHANGFPAGTYRELFAVWRHAGHRVHAPDKIGHDPELPVSNNWPHLRDQLAAFVMQKAPDGAVLVGHSLGGYLALMVACRYPPLARALVLIDAPIVAGWRAHSVQVMKATGLFMRLSPGRVSQRRRHEWPSRRALRDHFASKAAFARWDPKVLADYLRHGFVEEAGGTVRLAFRREIETRIYATLPHHLGALVHRDLPACPVSFIGGTQSVEVRQAGLATRALVGDRLRWIEGTHLFPMERPAETAELVLELVDPQPR